MNRILWQDRVDYIEWANRLVNYMSLQANVFE